MGTRHHTPEPPITFSRAMSQYLIEKQPNVIATVRHCPAFRFSGLVKHAATTATNPEKCAQDLAACDYAHLPDRWYAICTLLEAGATPFWASSWVDATQDAAQEIMKSS